MTKQERQEQLAALVFERGTMRIEELQEMLDVSSMTLYRDLAELESRRAIVRTRGEVSAAATSLSETSFGFRLGLEPASKRALAPLAAGLVARGDSVLVDDSTTSFFALEQLLTSSPRSLTVVTNCQGPAELVMQHPQVELIMIGGRFDRRLQANYGPAAISALNQLRVDVALLGAAAVQQDSVLHPYEDVAAFKSAVLPRARTRVLTLTSSKFTRSALYTVSRLEDFEVIITDLPGQAPELAPARQAGVRVLTPG